MDSNECSFFVPDFIIKHLPYVHCINIPTSHSASQENAIGGASTCLVELIAFDRPGGWFLLKRTLAGVLALNSPMGLMLLSSYVKFGVVQLQEFQIF